MKRLVSVMLIAMLSFGLMASVWAADVGFADVKPDDWFYEDVKIAVESGLVSGKSETSYAPDDNLTYAEAIKLAACMNELYTKGEISLKPGNPWYQSFVDYCVAGKIINKEYDYNTNVTRAGYMTIFANALPEEAFGEINNIPDGSIPDVSVTADYAEGVYKLYRAGIVAGVDDDHNCNPYANIKRSEVAAILTRMMNQHKRVEFSMGGASSGGGSSSGGSSSGGSSSGGSSSGNTAGTGEAEPALKVENITGATLEIAHMKSGEVKVTASGGAGEYEYKWQYNTGDEWKNVAFGGGDQYTFTGGEGTNALEITGATDDYSNGMKIRCIVTDGKGNSVTSDETTIKVVSSGGVKDKFEKVDGVELKTEDFKMPVDEVLVITNTCIILTGKIEAGKVLNNSKIYINDSEGTFVTEATVTGIEMFNKLLDEAQKGDSVGIRIDLEIDEWRYIIRSGFVASAEKGNTGELIVAVHPAAAQTETGKTAKLVVVPRYGVPPYKYTWQKVSVSLTGTTTWTDVENASKNILEVTPLVSGSENYRCVITDSAGNEIYSNGASVTASGAAVEATALEITVQPADTSATVGNAAAISVTASGGTKPYTYQWSSKSATKNAWINLADGTYISGTATAELKFTPTSAGETVVKCIVKDADGNQVSSEAVTITATAPEGGRGSLPTGKNEY